MLSWLVIAFLPRRKHLLVSWLQLPSAVILELKKIKSVTVSIVSPIYFPRSVNKIDNHNESGMGKEKEILKERKKIQKKLQNKSNHKNNKCFSWVTAVRVFSLPGDHSSPHLPRMPSNTVLISGPAVRAAQILIWFYSCVFLPPMSTAIRTSVFSFVGALNGFLYIP